MLSVVGRVASLLVAEAVIFFAAWRLNETRRDEGPVVLPLLRGHGLHRMDALMIAAALLAAILVLGWPQQDRAKSRGRSSRQRERR